MEMKNTIHTGSWNGRTGPHSRLCSFGYWTIKRYWS